VKLSFSGHSANISLITFASGSRPAEDRRDSVTHSRRGTRATRYGMTVVLDANRGGFRHVQHVRPNRGPHKKGAPQKDIFSCFATW